jgi:hypothetical protein
MHNSRSIANDAAQQCSIQQERGSSMEGTPVTPERELALKNRIRLLRERGAFTYASLLGAVAAKHESSINKNADLKKPYSSTFSRWLAGSADIETQWVLWLEEYLNSLKLTTDYDQTREEIGSISNHYIAHAIAHYVGIKPDAQANTEMEVPGLYATWIPSSILPGAFVFGLANIEAPEPGVITIKTFQEHQTTGMTEMWFDHSYLGRAMESLGWADMAPYQPEPARPAITLQNNHNKTRNPQTSPHISSELPPLQIKQAGEHTALSVHDAALMLDLVTTQPSEEYIRNAQKNYIGTIKQGTNKNSDKYKNLKSQGHIHEEDFNEEDVDLIGILGTLKAREVINQEEYDTLKKDFLDSICREYTILAPLKNLGDARKNQETSQIHAARARKRINMCEGYFYRIRGSFEAHLWDHYRVAYTRYDLTDFEHDLGYVVWMKGICQTRFGTRWHVKPVFFQRIAHVNGHAILEHEDLIPLINIYPPAMLPPEVRAFFVRAAERMKNSINQSGYLIVEL